MGKFPTIKQFLKSKMIWLSLFITILGIVQDNIAGLQLSPEYQSLALMVLGILIAVLRFVTTIPLNQK